MVTLIWVNIGPGSCLLLDSTKPLPELMLTHQWRSMAFTWKQFHSECPKLLFCIITLKIILLKLLPHLPGANELTTIIFYHFSAGMTPVLSLASVTTHPVATPSTATPMAPCPSPSLSCTPPDTVFNPPTQPEDYIRSSWDLLVSYCVIYQWLSTKLQYLLTHWPLEDFNKILEN